MWLRDSLLSPWSILFWSAIVGRLAWEPPSPEPWWCLETGCEQNEVWKMLRKCLLQPKGSTQRKPKKVVGCPWQMSKGSSPRAEPHDWWLQPWWDSKGQKHRSAWGQYSDLPPQGDRLGLDYSTPHPWKIHTNFFPTAPVLIQNRKIEPKVFSITANSSVPEEQNGFALDFFFDSLFACPVPKVPTLSSLGLLTQKKNVFGASWELAHTAWLLGRYPKGL